MRRFTSVEKAIDWLQSKRVIIDHSDIVLGLGEKYGLRVWGAIDYLLNSDRIFRLSWRR